MSFCGSIRERKKDQGAFLYMRLQTKPNQNKTMFVCSSIAPSWSVKTFTAPQIRIQCFLIFCRKCHPTVLENYQVIPLGASTSKKVSAFSMWFIRGWWRNGWLKWYFNGSLLGKTGKDNSNCLATDKVSPKLISLFYIFILVTSRKNESQKKKTLLFHCTKHWRWFSTDRWIILE